MWKVPVLVDNKGGAGPWGSTPAEFGALIDSEIAKWTTVLRKAGIKPE